MSYETVEYNGVSFEENPHLLTWLQFYLIQQLEKKTERPAWTNQLLEVWEVNAQLDIYKYFFDNQILDGEEKIQYTIRFVSECISELDLMDLREFAEKINITVRPDFDFNRVKRALSNLRNLLKGKQAE